MRPAATLSGVEALAHDDLIALQRPQSGDAERLVAGRDDEWRRWLGPGSDTPKPTGCIFVGDTLVGWVDYDTDQTWLQHGEVNVGYSVFAAYRGRGYATRAVHLLLDYLARTTEHHTATLLINADNVRSLGVAARLGCREHPPVGASRCFKIPIERPDQ